MRNARGTSRAGRLPRLLLTAIAATACAAGRGAAGQGPSVTNAVLAADKPPFWQTEATAHPPVTDVSLPLFAGHPRLVFRPAGDRGLGRTFDDVRRLHAEDATFKAIFGKALQIPERQRHPAAWAAMWIVTGDDACARGAVERMVSDTLTKSGEPYYSDVWSFALAYDWLHGHPALAPTRDAVVAKIVERLGTEIDNLDGKEMALWHGRNQAANGVMIAALAVGDLPEGGPLLRRAAAHYIESLRALQFSEGWPEGASYWIYNRAGPYALAADCVMSALGSDSLAGIPIREVCRKIGFWQLYSFAPNGVFEPYGDSAGSLRLGETGWWELTTDHFARLSRDPGLMAGADYIRNRSPSPYGARPYQWNIAITYDPGVRPKAGYDPATPETWMRANLPQAMLFGRDSMGVAFFRGRWGDPDELYATFKAGDLLAHHDHYDTGHFGIQRGGLLAPLTGLYGPGGYDGRYRLGYAIQTVAANSLLVLAPGETSGYLRGRKAQPRWDSLSGGQRVIRPTGFDCVGLAHYQAQLRAGPHLERARISAFESVPGVFDYVAADITAAYNSTRWAEPGSGAKLSLATRQFLFLRGESAFVLYDRVETAGPRFLPKFVVHHLSKPRTPSEKLLSGPGPDDGILETLDRELVTAHGRGKLAHRVLLPERMRALKIGGPGHSCYVEDDGDQADGFDGQDLCVDPLKAGTGAKPGLWRTEVEPLEPGAGTRFLNVLHALPAEADSPRPAETLDAGAPADAVRVGGVVCVFARDPKPLESVTLAVPGDCATCLVLDAVPGAEYSVQGRRAVASAEGVLSVAGPFAGSVSIRLKCPVPAG